MDIVSKICRILLISFGWKPFYSPEQRKLNKSVVVISHTSIWDAIVFVVYKLAYPEWLGHAKIVVKTEIYDVCPEFVQNILNQMGFVRAPSYAVKNGGFVNATAESLQNLKSYMFLISPKGMRDVGPWRTGYYVIAQKLNVDIMAGGLDFEKKKIVFYEPISIKDKTKEQVEKILRDQIGQIVPLYPNCSEVDLRKYSPENVSLFSLSHVLILVLVTGIFLYLYNKTTFIICLIFFVLLI
jgi:1-acyl-sn-glycerol-3-phosphate acyltransferase